MGNKHTVQTDPNNNNLNPDGDIIRQVRRVVKERAKEKVQKTNFFSGKIKYRIVGSRLTTKNKDLSKNIAGFDIRHAAADPFRDSEVDRERVNSKGVVDRDTITDSNVVFVHSDDLYHSLFRLDEDKAEGHNILATFLLRIRYNVKKFSRLVDTKDAHVQFSFKDRENLRDPVIEESRGLKQELTEEQPARASGNR